MSRGPRLLDLIDDGHQQLFDGDLDRAQATLERAARIDQRHPGVRILRACITAAGGEPGVAIEQLQALAKDMPEEVEPMLFIAEIELIERDDPTAAIDAIDAVLENIDDDSQLFRAVCVRAEALLARGDEGDPAAARESLAELSTSIIEDPSDQLTLAALWLEADAPTQALALAASAAKDPEFTADALHLSGFAHANASDFAAVKLAWQQVRTLDSELPPAPWRPSHDQIDAWVKDAIAELSDQAQAHLAQVPILLDERPTEAQVDDHVDPRALGLFAGTPVGERGTLGEVASPTAIYLFLGNLERMCADADELAEEIRITVLHETAHFFGLDEDAVADVGLA